MPTVHRRACAPSDQQFLLELFAATRADELAALSGSAADRQRFVATQFEAQDRHYRQYCPDDAFEIVLADDMPVGRVVVHRGQDVMTLVDFAIVPGRRGRGIGSAVLAELVAEAISAHVPLRCHVHPTSGAQRLYERAGFVVTGHDGPLLALEYPCPISAR